MNEKNSGAVADNPAASRQGARAHDDETRALIEHHTLFQGVPTDILEALVRDREIRQLAAGDILLQPGQENTNLYLLLSGQLRVHIGTVDSDSSFLIKPDECAGEISVVDNKPPTAFVVVDQPSLVLVLPEETLWEDLLQVPSIAKNFMRMFADRFRANNRAIQDALEKQRRYEYLRKELAFAYDIQLGMLPHQLNLGPTVDIATGMQPAREVGGDFFDAFPVRPDEYAVVIGDISGTGVPAALFMVRTMTLLRTELLKDQPLADAVRGLNGMLHQDNAAGMFATLVVGMFNRKTGRFDYINAGHDPVILGERGTSYRALPAATGPRIGIDRDAAFEVASVTLDKDDVLVLHTDGITDAKNDAGETFGPDRLLACLEENSATSAGELADRINRTVHRFVAGAPQSDDMTMVILRYPGT